MRFAQALGRRHLFGRLLSVVLVATGLSSAAPARGAAPATVIDKAATALAGNPVYVDPQAEQTISPAEAKELRNEIGTQGHGPIYIAVLRAAAVNEAGGDVVGVIDEVHRRLGRRGVYAAVAGGHFRAEASDLPPGRAGDLAATAFDAHHDDGIGPTLVDFVDRVGRARTGGSGTDGGEGGGGGLFGRIGLLPILLVAGLGFFVFRRFSGNRRDAEQFADVKESARLDLVALADDVQDLERRVETNPAARRDYDAALQQYERASSAFDGARNASQLEPVAQALEEGRYLMASAEARLDDKEPPERRPPCFFDPRHGPSVRDVAWSPDGGATRAVPACAACAVRVEEGVQPESRQVIVRGQSMPYWAAGPAFGGYFGGFFPGLLLGEIVGQSFDTGPFDSGGFGGDFSGGGDFGGGGGGGDFGGGGGGDGGGGDF